MGVLDAFKGGLRRSVNPKSLGSDATLEYDWQNMDTLQLERLKDLLASEGTIGPTGPPGSPGAPGPDNVLDGNPVDAATPALGDVLVFDGTSWVNDPSVSTDSRQVEYGPWGTSTIGADVTDEVLTMGFE